MYISQSENSKSKICAFACINSARVKNLLRFALSFTISELTVHLRFRGHVILRVMGDYNWKFQNLHAVTLQGMKIRPDSPRSLTVSRQIYFFKVMWPWGSCDLKSKKYFACNNHEKAKNSPVSLYFLRFLR